MWSKGKSLLTSPLRGTFLRATFDSTGGPKDKGEGIHLSDKGPNIRDK